MNILYLLFSFNVGGAERLVVDTVNGMYKKGHNVKLCIINDHYSDDLLDEVDKNVEVILFNRSVGGSKLTVLFKLARLIHSYNIDVLHCQEITGVQSAIIAKLLFPKLRVYYTVHNLVAFNHLRSHQIKLVNIICKKIISISNSVKYEIIRNGISPKKTVLIYNAIDFEKFTLSNRKLTDENSFVIGNVARVFPEQKGQDILIKAVGELHSKGYPIQCYFAGAPVDNRVEYINELISISKKLGIESNIHFLNNVIDIPQFLNSIDIFVLPSRTEGFGIALIEALASGIPCVASNIAGPSEILNDNKLGMTFVCEDVTDLVNKIETVINHRDKFDKTYLRNNVEKRFGIKRFLDETESVYLQ